MKIVVDTNLLIDGSSDDYHFGSRIVDDVIAGKLMAYANRQTLAENKLMARRKITDENYLRKLDEYFAAVNLLDIRNRLRVVEDWDDNKILESAVDAGAEFLISSDKHLLKLMRYGQVQIVTPQKFWNEYEQGSGAGWKNWLADFIK